MIINYDVLIHDAFDLLELINHNYISKLGSYLSNFYRVHNCTVNIKMIEI